jgi:actin-related protein
MIRGSLAACDPDIRPALMNNIVVTGGTSLLQGMTTRIEQEMQRDTASKVRVHAAGNGMERICGKWIGGSILASLGSFHQLYVFLFDLTYIRWITKQEYEESGRDWNLLQKRCP